MKNIATKIDKWVNNHELLTGIIGTAVCLLLLKSVGAF